MEPGKLVRQLCYQDQALLTKRGRVKVDCYLVDFVVQRASQQELYIPYLQTFKFYKF